MGALAAGVSGPLDVLASHTGWPPERVRQAIKEMRRSREVAMTGRQSRAGGGQPAGVYAKPNEFDALTFLRAAWR